MKILTLLCLALPAAPLPTTAQENPVREAYTAAFAAGDEAAAAELFAAQRTAVLPTIDEDLEGMLAAIEQARANGTTPDEERLAAMRARARFGARAATRAGFSPILEDYVASFLGWNTDEQTSFRAGQAAHGQARKALREKDAASALAAARECRERAAPLGDWWGTAMGYAAEGEALAQQGEHAAAAAAFGQARLLYAGLGLARAELAALIGLADAARAGGNRSRERECLVKAIELSAASGLAEHAATLGERLRALGSE